VRPSKLIEGAGVTVTVPERSACCGLTWISTGQLSAARRRLNDLLDVFEPYAAAGLPILGLEPSCTAVLRSDLLELLPDDPARRAGVAPRRDARGTACRRTVPGDRGRMAPARSARVYQRAGAATLQHHSVMGSSPISRCCVHLAPRSRR